jgi:sirohydrochlorin cobaltochelatase
MGEVSAGPWPDRAGRWRAARGAAASPLAARWLAVLLLAALAAFSNEAQARGKAKDAKARPAVVLAAFGSASPQGMAGVEKAKAAVEARFPGVPVRVGLTGRHAVASLKAPGVLTAMARLADEGYRDIALIPLHVSAGAEYDDLRALADALNAVAKTGVNKPPFNAIVLGEPLLGAPARRTAKGEPAGGRMRGNPAAISQMADALAEDAALAKADGAALVYAGHGNPDWRSAEFEAFQAAMAKANPGAVVLAGTLESRPGLAEVLAALKKSGKSKVILFPLLFGAGVHAADDLCGGKDSWKSALEAAGYDVDCRMRGLGEADAVASLIAARAEKALTALGYSR